MELTTEDLDNYAVNNTRKMAGQSLTEDPSSPAPYLKPPRFTTKEEAVNYFFDYITDEERFTEIMDILEEGVPVMDVVQLILMNSFEKGEINPDMNCVWVQAWEGNKRIHKDNYPIQIVQPPVDNRLIGRSAWLREVRLKHEV